MPITTQSYYGVESPTYQPAMRNILSITQAVQALVTTTFDGTTPGDHDYGNGLIVRLLIPNGFGMVEANELYGVVTIVNSAQFTVSIDTTLFDPFVIPPYQPGHHGTPAQVVPFGEINEILTQATRNVLPYP